MAVKIALAGNPNCGKTTMFNDLTGSNQYVGNWPGVTVEKKEGRLKGDSNIVIQDLPGIYSLSPYTLEEVVARSYLVNDKPDAILNIVDASNIERNLYLTTQLSELGIPMVIALNMIDVTRKNGDKIDVKKLAKELGCEIVETSALKGEGSVDAAKLAAQVAQKKGVHNPPHVFQGSVEHALAHIEDLITHNDGQEAEHHHHADGSVHQGGIVADNLSRWYAIKLFERDEKACAELNLPENIKKAVEEIIVDCEKEMDDDSESIITNQRYAYIAKLMDTCVKKGQKKGSLTVSDKIDRIVTNRILALPIFVVVMGLVYYIAVTTIGTIVTDFTNDTFVAAWIQEPVKAWLENIGCAEWLVGLIGDGIIGGVGAVIGFVPQMLVLFFMLAILEDVGYMARVAFIMDRIFRKLGLSGKSFIPMLISSGCGVPGVMASRTIENDRDRKMTIMTTTFIPCGAKMPIIGLIAGALFHNAGWVATAAYFIGVAAVIFSGIVLKKTKIFAGDPAPFVMELPSYHAPAWTNVFHSMWERGWSFIKRAGTVILLSSIVIWLTSNYGWTKETTNAEVADNNVEASETATDETEDAEVAETETAETETAETGKTVFGAVEDMDDSILGRVGSVAAPIFKPLGFGDWKPTVATVMGLVAKEEVVNVFGVLYSTDTDDMDTATLVDEGDAEQLEEGLSPIAQGFAETSNGHGKLAAFAFMLFNLLCCPCFAALGAIKREMNNPKWTWFAIAYQCIFAYCVSLVVYQLGLLFMGGGFTASTIAAIVVLIGMLYLLFRKNPYDEEHLNQKVRV